MGTKSCPWIISSRVHVATHLIDDKGFDLLRNDVTFPLFVEVDEIYNLACPASPIHYQLSRSMMGQS